MLNIPPFRFVTGLNSFICNMGVAIFPTQCLVQYMAYIKLLLLLLYNLFLRILKTPGDLTPDKVFNLSIHNLYFNQTDSQIDSQQTFHFLMSIFFLPLYFPNADSGCLLIKFYTFFQIQTHCHYL